MVIAEMHSCVLTAETHTVFSLHGRTTVFSLHRRKAGVLTAETHSWRLHLHRCEQLDLVHTRTEEGS